MIFYLAFPSAKDEVDAPCEQSEQKSNFGKFMLVYSMRSQDFKVLSVMRPLESLGSELTCVLVPPLDGPGHNCI